MKTARYFYRNSNLITTVEPLHSATLFSHGQQVMASVTRPGDQENTELISTDAAMSPLNGASSLGLRSTQFAAYGYTPPSTLLVGFKGERLDRITTHYLLGNGYRAYNPVLMRFNSPDVDSPFGRGGSNGYAFVSGDPINFSDSTGHFRLGLGRRRPLVPTTEVAGPMRGYGPRRADATNAPALLLIENYDGMTVIVGHGSLIDSTVGGFPLSQIAGVLPKSKTPIHLISCGAGSKRFDGSRTRQATGKKLAKETNRPVVTYKNDVHNVFDYDQEYQLVGLQLATDENHNAQPVTFYPPGPIKKTFNWLASRIRKNVFT